jgi:3-methyladenine DNA glycosylase AlkD
MLDFDFVFKMALKKIIDELETLADPAAAQGMARYGIWAKTVYGVSIPNLRRIAKETGRNQTLSLRLWKKESRETRILAAMIGEPDKVSEEQMEDWVREFDSWEICDQCIMNLFEKTEHSYRKAIEWCARDEEFVKRAGFVLMARLAVSDKKAPDEKFIQFFPLLKDGAYDGRNYVKKAVNWAIRQIGKRNMPLNFEAVSLAEKIRMMNCSSAHWIASDALRELKSEAVLKRIKV